MSIKYYVRSNSCFGLINKIETNLSDIDKIYVLKSESDDIKNNYIKTLVLNRLCAYLKDSGIQCEMLISPFSKIRLDGVIIRDKKCAFVDEECICSVESLLPKCIHIDLSSCVGNNISQRLNSIYTECQKEIKAVYSIYEEAKTIHDNWEKIYINNMNLTRLNSYNDYTIDKILSRPHKDGKGKITERFFGCAYSDENVNYIDKLTYDISKRYLIKGRPGTGKSTFMRRFAGKAMSMGYDVEVYFCAFDPYSLDMVVVRELSICVFDSTSPHEKMPVRNNDEILDLYVHSGLNGVDEKNQYELSDISQSYQKLMSDAKKHLKVHDDLLMTEKEIVVANINYDKFNEVVNTLTKSV